MLRRRQKDPGKKLLTQLHVQVTGDEKAALEVEAEEQGMSLSQLVRLKLRCRLQLPAVLVAPPQYVRSASNTDSTNDKSAAVSSKSTQTTTKLVLLLGLGMGGSAGIYGNSVNFDAVVQKTGSCRKRRKTIAHQGFLGLAA